MRNDVKKIVRECIPCQLYSTKNKYPVPTAPLEHIAKSSKCGEFEILDIWSAGDTNRSTFKFLAAIICPNCRRVKVRPLKNNNTDEVARFLIEQVFNPIFTKNLLSYNGKSVSSKHVKELLTAINAGVDKLNLESGKKEASNIKQRLSSPYQPLGHSQNERFFSTFGQSLRRLVRERPR